jgi:hypothetical protein
MKTKLLISTAIVSAICSLTTFADNTIPEKCPNVKAIVAAGLTAMHKLDQQSQKGWFGEQRSTYDTNQEWSFYVGLFDVNASENDALVSAQASLSTLHKIFGPIPSDENGHYGCLYTDLKNGGITAMASTPPVSFPSNLIPNLG